MTYPSKLWLFRSRQWMHWSISKTHLFHYKRTQTLILQLLYLRSADWCTMTIILYSAFSNETLPRTAIQKIKCVRCTNIPIRFGTVQVRGTVVKFQAKRLRNFCCNNRRLEGKEIIPAGWLTKANNIKYAERTLVIGSRSASGLMKPSIAFTS